MYYLRNIKYPSLYWSEVENRWVHIEQASIYRDGEDASTIECDVGSNKLMSLLTEMVPVEEDKKDFSRIIRMSEHNMHCDPNCPYLNSHKDESLDGDCLFMKRNIPWYDYHIAICSDIIENNS